MSKYYILETLQARCEKRLHSRRFEVIDEMKIKIEFDPGMPLSKFATYVETTSGYQSKRMRHDSLQDACNERDRLLQARCEIVEALVDMQINETFALC